MADRVVSRRSFLGAGATALGGLGLAGGLGVVLDACSSSGPSRNSITASSAVIGIAKGKPVRGGTLTMGTFSEVDGFDPTSSQWDTTGYLYGETVFDPLVAFAPDGTPRPYLAESVVPSPDYSSWTITLRPGIVFHDGTPLDSKALQMNLQRQVASALIGPALANIESISISDPLSVVVAMKGPWVPFDYYLADQPGYIAAPSMLNNPNGSTNPIGTGPFVFEQWEQNVKFTAKANPHYWRPGLPYLDAIEFRPFDSPATMSTSILSGQIDAATTTDQGTILYFSRNGGYQVVDDRNATTVLPDQNCIILNTTKAPVDDIRVRQAMAYSVDKQKIIDDAFSGLGAASDGPFVEGSRYYSNTGYPQLDLGKARQLVHEYTSEKGPIVLEVGIPSGDQTYTLIADMLLSMWKQIDIEGHITQTEYSEFVADAALGNYMVDGWQQFGCNDPDENYVWWSTDTVNVDGQLSLNVARNSDSRIQTALQKGRTQSDPSARQQAYQQVASYLAEDLPYLWINRSVSGVVASNKVQNFNATTFPDGSAGQGVSGGTFRFSTTWKLA